MKKNLFVLLFAAAEIAHLLAQELPGAMMKRPSASEGNPGAMMAKPAEGTDGAGSTPSGVFDLQGMHPAVEAFTSESDLDKLAARRTVVLFFAASWDSGSRDSIMDIRSHLRTFPSDLVVVVADFDQSVELKSRFRIQKPGTFVVLTSRGMPARSWAGLTTMAELVQKTRSR